MKMCTTLHIEHSTLQLAYRKLELDQMQSLVARFIPQTCDYAWYRLLTGAV